MEEVFDWNRMLFNDLPKEFLWEVVFRSVVMFLFLLVTLMLTGKRGVKQLSIFETVLIIALGSAAGDPMFYEDVGIVPAVIVFLSIISLYRAVTWLTGKSQWFENLIEGKSLCLINEGKFSIDKFKKENLAQDEFFSEMRIKGIEHLGQIRHAFLEPSGELSVFFFPDEQVRPGLPILPDIYATKSKTIYQQAIYACAFCGHTELLIPGKASCTVCCKEEWVLAIDVLRVT